MASSAPEGCDTHVPSCTRCPALPPSQVWQDGLGLSRLETGKTSALAWPKGSWHPSSLIEPQLLPCNWLPCRVHATKPFHSGKPSHTFTASKGATPQMLKSINPPSQSLFSTANRFHGQPRRSRGRFLYPAEANQRICFHSHNQPKNSRTTPARATALVPARKAAKSRLLQAANAFLQQHFSSFLV